MNGYHVDLILRDIKRVEQIIKDTEQGIVTANYQTGHPHGYISAMYRGELAISKIQYAKNETFEYKSKKYAERVNHIFEILGLSLFECYDMTEKLYKEVKKIATEINNFLNEGEFR